MSLEPEQSRPDLEVPEALADFVLNNTFDPMVIVSVDQIVEINDVALWILGYDDKSEIIGRRPSSLMTPASALQAERNTAERLAGNWPSLSDHYEFVKKNGDVIQLNTVLLPWPLKPELAVVLAFNVTERERKVQALRESERLYRLLAEAIPAGVILQNDRGETVYVNEQATIITGYTAEEIAAGVELTHPEEVSTSYRDPASETSGRGCRYLTRFRTKTGETIWVSVTKQRIQTEYGQSVWVHTVFEDITDHIRAAQALEDAEERYRLFAENSSDVMWQMDCDGVLTYVSPAVRRLGYEPEELIGRMPTAFMPADEQAKFYQYLTEGLRDLVPRRYDMQFVSKDGSAIWMDVSVDFVLDQGVPIRIQGIARDVTERKLTLDALRESESRFRDVLESSRDATYKLDLSTHQFDYVSPSAEWLFGYSPDDVLAMRLEGILEKVYPEDVIRLKKHVERLMDGSDIDLDPSIEFRFLHRDGQYRWVNDSMTVVRDADGVAIGLVGSWRDVTERKMADEMLRQTHEELERAYKIQQEFLNSVTHEVRTPLTAVRGYAEMLLHGTVGPVTDEQAGLLKKVLSSSDHLIQIVNSVLEMARLKSGVLAINKRVCNPCQIVERAVSAVSPQAMDKGIEISASSNSHPRATGVYDEEKIAIILTNLLSNSVKFTERGSIEIEADCGPDGFEIVVVDTGIGILDSELPLIFDEFRQLEYPGKHKPAGFGLGLAIVAAMVDALSGSLTVSSVHGLGTAFTLYVPRMEA